MQHLSSRALDLVQRCVDGELLDADEMDVLFDELGVSTPEQVVVLARVRGWDDQLTAAQHVYVREFEGFLRGEAGARSGMARALREMRAETSATHSAAA